MRKQFPACKKKIEDSLCCKEGSSRHHKHKELSASAFPSEQPQQPQFPKEKKKKGPEQQNYDQFWTPSESIRGRACP